jgi:hypothetical protein
MHSGEWLTRGTVWLALAFYVVCEALNAKRSDSQIRAVARWLNTMGCAFFLAHVIAAFHYHYSWSHAMAHAETARQTKELVGWNSGDGLYFNYLFALVWLSEVTWSWIIPRSYSNRSSIWNWTVRLFFLLMIFNGAFFFVRGNIRWFGLFLCLMLIASWLFKCRTPTRIPCGRDLNN